MENTVKMRLNKMSADKIVKKILWHLLALVLVAIIIFPFVWMIPGAFKDKTEIFKLPNSFLPKEFSLKNFKTMLEVEDIHIQISMANTFIVCVTAVVLSLIVNTVAAYAFARIEFPFKKTIFAICLATMFIPGISILLSSVQVVYELGMIDTFWVLVLPGVASAYNIFFFRQFFYNIPDSLEEAAMIDGAGHIKIFLQIYLPLSVTPMVLIGMGVFVGYWNSYMWPTLVITKNKDLYQITQIIRTFETRFASNYGVTITAALLAMLVPISLFAVFQRRIMQGVAITGLK